MPFFKISVYRLCALITANVDHLMKLRISVPPRALPIIIPEED